MAQTSLNSTGVASSGSLVLQSNGTTTAVTIDTSQNVGLGVTPSAWGSGYTAQQLKQGNIWSTGTNIHVGSNAFWNGTNYIYQLGDFASRLNQVSGEFRFFNAPSGTAGNAITFTQAMTLDASGNLGIGTTSPTAPLHISRDSETQAIINRATTTTGASFVRFTNGGGNYYLGPDSSTGTRAFSSGGAAYGFSISVEGVYPIVFGTSNAERARIDSSGNFLVASTSVPTTNGFAALQYSGGTYTRIAHNSSGATSDGYIQFWWNNTQIGQVSQNGTTGITYGTSSDYRLKENIEPMQNALATVAALKPCIYKWKVDGSDGQGFIAHELQSIVPDAVIGEKDAVNEDGSIKPQAIDTSFLVATLTAAIQELNAKFEAYKATHP
jgi:hypothetical protein